MKSQSYIAAVLCLSLSTMACQWVNTTEEAKAVSLVKAEHVEHCQKLGRTRTSVAEKVGFLKRGERKVAEELVTLAQNDAIDLGGDTIVAESAVEEGTQSFSIYKCR